MLEFDPRVRTTRPIELPPEVQEGTTGMAGICSYEAGYLALLQPNVLLRLSPTLEVVDYRRLDNVADGHSVAYYSGATYVVSTGTDRVERVWDSHEKDVFWKASEGDVDTVHLNSLVWYGGECYVSGFGRKKGELWRSADDGFVYNITRSEYLLRGVHHPHSATFIDDEIWLCESSRVAVINDRGIRIETPWGYLRGLCRQDNHLYVGSTFGRNKSKSTGVVIDNHADPGVRSGMCGVGVIRLGGTPSIVDFIDMSDYAEEIYDIIQIAE